MILVCVTHCSYASTKTDATSLAVAMQNLPLFMQPLAYPALFVLIDDQHQIVETLGDSTLSDRIHNDSITDVLNAAELCHWLNCKHFFMTDVTS